MLFFRHFACAVIATFLFLFSALQAGQAAEPKDPFILRIAAQAPGLSYYSYSVTLAKLIEKFGPPGSKLEVIPRGGGMGNPTTLDQGRCELAFSDGLSSIWAWHGLESV